MPGASLNFKLDYKWVALSVTTVGTFMAALDSSIVVIGLPTIINSFTPVSFMAYGLLQVTS